MIGLAAKNGCSILMNSDMMPTPMMVRQKNCLVNAEKAINSMAALSTRIDVPVGIPVA